MSWHNITSPNFMQCLAKKKKKGLIQTNTVLNILAAFGNIEIETKHWRLTGQGQSNSRSVVHEGNGVTQ